MIQIDSELYTADLHMTELEAGTLLEYAFDLMEMRGQQARTKKKNFRKTEIIPDFPQAKFSDMDEELALAFTGSEWQLIAEMAYLFREHGIIPDLRIYAYVNEVGDERGIELMSEIESTSIEVPVDKSCGLLSLMKDIIDNAETLISL